MVKHSAFRAPRSAFNSAFTLIELLVVIAIIGILSALLMPSLSKGKQRAQGIQCMNNGKQMMVALMLYTGDNNEFYPPNPDDGNTLPGYNWCGGQAGIGGAQEFNPDVLKDPTRSLLSAYLANNIAVFRCSADRRQGMYQGSDPNLAGQTVPAARTFAMSQAVGTIDARYDQVVFGGTPEENHKGAPNMSVNGPWLDNRHSNRRNSPWNTYGKATDVVNPSPSMLWVFIDEDAGGLNDAAFAFGMEEAEWIDAPGTYHNGGCGFAFADGHSETHGWVSKGRKQINGSILSPADRQDWQWMQQRTSARHD